MSCEVEVESKIVPLLSDEEHKALDRFNELKDRGYAGQLNRKESFELAMLEIRLGL